MEGISSWAQGIIIAVIIGTIIEMLLPKNKNSKYIKVVIGMFVLFTIVAPVMGKITNNNIELDFNIEDYEIETSSNIQIENIEEQNNNQIMNIYKQNLELDIQSKVQIKGYKTEYVIAEILNDANYTINKIELKIIEKNEEIKNEQQVASIVDNIETIKINLTNSSNSNEQESILTEKEKKTLKQYLADCYEINEQNIVII